MSMVSTPKHLVCPHCADNGYAEDGGLCDCRRPDWNEYERWLDETEPCGLAFPDDVEGEDFGISEPLEAA